MKLIKLTKHVTSAKLKVNPIMITAIEEAVGSTAGSVVYTIGNTCWSVKESIDEVAKLIQDSDRIILKNTNEKP